jgi:hypothetical protein
MSRKATALDAEFTAASAGRRPQPAPGHLRSQGAGEDELGELYGWPSASFAAVS